MTSSAENNARLDCELFESLYGHLHSVQVAMKAGRDGLASWTSINKLFADALRAGLDSVK